MDNELAFWQSWSTRQRLRLLRVINAAKVAAKATQANAHRQQPFRSLNVRTCVCECVCVWQLCRQWQNV